MNPHHCGVRDLRLRHPLNVNPWFRLRGDGRSPVRAPSISLTWTLLSVAIALLLGQAVIGFVVGRNGVADLALAIATALLVASAVLNARASGILVARRNSEAESFSRLLQALSRSVSPERGHRGHRPRARHRHRGGPRRGRAAATRRNRPGRELRVDAARIADRDVGHADPAAGARRGATASCDVRRSRNSAFPTWDTKRTRTTLPTRSPHRLRDAYGLRNTLAAPLLEGESIVGAIVLSRRTNEPWTESVGPAAEQRGRRDDGRARTGLLASGGRGRSSDRPAHRAAEPALLRRVLHPRGQPPASLRPIGDPGRGRRPLQARQRHVRAPDRRPGPSGDRRRDPAVGPGGGSPRPLRRRGVHGPAAQPVPGRGARGGRADPPDRPRHWT